MWREANAINLPKNFERGSEDYLLKLPNVHAVLDGVSSGIQPGEDVPLLHGLTPGQFAAQTVGKAMPQAASDYSTPKAFVRHLAQSLHDGLQQFAGQEIGKPACTFVAHVPQHNVIIRVGDGPFMIDEKAYGGELAVDERKSRFRAAYLKFQLKKGVDIDELIRDDPTRATMEKYTREWQPQFTNSHDAEYGYGVINGKRVPEQHIEVFEVPSTAKRIVLASDGFPDFVLRHDMPHTMEAMRDLMQEDPLCIDKWVQVRGLQPNGRWPDDAAALWLERQE